MSVATFPPASLQSQLTELRRERKQRVGVYEHLISARKLDRRTAEFRNNGLDGAIRTLERLAEAEARGEPGRRELLDGLRTARRRLEELGAAVEWLDELLAKVPE